MPQVTNKMKKQHVGVDFSSVPVVVQSTGNNAARPTTLSELNAAIAQLVAGYQAADSALNSTIQTQLESLESQIGSGGSQGGSPLTVASNSFLSIAANQLNAALNGDYFTVTGGSLTLSAAFLLRISDLEDETAALQSDLQTAAQALHTATHKTLLLTDGVFNSGEETTTFVVDPGFSNFNFWVVGVREVAAPYELVTDPQIKLIQNPANNRPAVEIVFYGSPQVANNTLSVGVICFDPAAIA